MMRAWMSSLLLLAVADAGPDPRQVAWERSWTEARARSESEGRLLFVAVNMDGEGANDTMASEVYRDRGIVALTRHTVPVIASRFDHGADEDEPCPRFGGIGCRAHRDVDIAVRAKVLEPDETGYVVAPQHVFLNPEGDVLISVPYQISTDELEWCLRTALREVDPDVCDAPDESLRPPKRLLRGAVYSGELEKGISGDGPVAAADLEEFLAAVTPLDGDARRKALQRLILSDDPRAVEFMQEEVTRLADVASSEKDKQAAESAARDLGKLLRTMGLVGGDVYWEIAASVTEHVLLDVRRECAIALEQLAVADARKSIEAALKDEEEPAVRKCWLRALGTVGAREKKVRRVLYDVARSDRDRTIRVNAIVALGYLPHDKTVSKLLEQRLRSGENAERRAAAIAMGLAMEPRYRELLEKQVRTERNGTVRQVCERVLAVLDGEPLQILSKDLKNACEDKVVRERLYGKAK